MKVSDLIISFILTLLTIATFCGLVVLVKIYPILWTIILLTIIFFGIWCAIYVIIQGLKALDEWGE